MIDSAGSRFFPSGNTYWTTANTVSQITTVQANQNIQAILVDNLSGGGTVYVRTAANATGLFANSITAGQNTASFPVYAGSRIIIGCGSDNSSNQTMHVALVTGSSTANVLITPVI